MISLLLALLPGPALAEEPTAPRAPAFAVIALTDAPGDADCPPAAAARGDCLERAQILDPGPAFEGSSTRAERVRWRLLSRLPWLLWEDMAHQGFGEESLLAETLLAAGFDTLPESRLLWDAARPDPHLTVAFPDRAAWLRPADLWRPLRVVQPEGLPALPAVTVLAGRFASRMGFDGRAWDYELMDADPQSSGPFFEQLYPFRAAAGSPESVPLRDFDLPEALAGWLAEDAEGERTRAALAPTLLAEADQATLEAAAGEQFERWARIEGVRIAEYALRDHTVNQMRVLAALSLMRSAPDSLEQSSGRTRSLVAAALGETDDQAQIASRLDPSIFALQGGFALRYEVLPASVTWAWLARLGPWSPTELAALSGDARAFLGRLAREGAATLPGVDQEALLRWGAANLQAGVDPSSVAEDLARLALRRRVLGLPEGERARAETWILLDHVQDAVGSLLDPSGQTRLSPADLADQTRARWVATLKRHGAMSRPLEQGLGAVDPTAICTTGDGAAALSEATVGAVELNLILDAPAGLTDAGVALWAARGQIPVLAVDDPEQARPTLERLADLPGDRSLYRVRWRLWSGWHLLWDAVEVPGVGTRLAGRTAAICEDLTLVSTSLAPTVLRAGLLEGELRPTTPARRRDLRGERREERPPAQKEAVELEDVAEDLMDRPDATADRLAGEEVSERTRWLRALVRPALDARAEGGLLLMVLELDDARRAPPLRDWPPRTPYLRATARAGQGAARGAGWILWLDGPGGREAVRAAPGTAPRASVAVGSELPRWRRTWTTDYLLMAGLSAIPLNVVWSTCDSALADADVVAACEDEAVTTSAQGAGLELMGGTRISLGPAPRLGFELGLLAQLEATTPGGSLLYSDGLDYAFALRPSGGLVLGISLAPRPAGLARRSGSPWGAERPDGTSRLGRAELGLRVGLLAGPGYNGAEATAIAELWGGAALRRARGKNSALTPYYPAFLLTPWARVGYGFPLFTESSDLLVLDERATLVIGLRGAIRVQEKVEVPEVAP